MSYYPVHTLESAPTAAQPSLEKAKQAFGFIPNLLGVMANSPLLTETYLTLSNLFNNARLTATERQVVLLTVSQFHGCHYCVAAHSMLAAMQQIPDEVVAAIRHDQPIADPKLQALRQLTRQLVEQRGWLEEADVHAFVSAGYEADQIMDVLVGIAQKMLSNFTNHLAETPLDAVFQQYAWQPVS